MEKFAQLHVKLMSLLILLMFAFFYVIALAKIAVPQKIRNLALHALVQSFLILQQVNAMTIIINALINNVFIILLFKIY